MNQFRTKHLEAFPQFFDLMVDFFFEVRSFLDLVTDMDVHESLERGKKIP